jgi:hypothetical protein
MSILTNHWQAREGAVVSIVAGCCQVVCDSSLLRGQLHLFICR